MSIKILNLLLFLVVIFMGVVFLSPVEIRTTNSNEDVSPIVSHATSSTTPLAPRSSNVATQATATSSTAVSLTTQKTPRTIATPTQVIPEVATPGALYVPKTPPSASASPAISDDASPISASGALNQQDIFDIVNSERAKLGLGALTYNNTLSVIAEVKAKDMISKQYFAHVSPDGTDIAKLAERNHYDYINIGENLAMGDFSSSAEVMEGWMNSPGHRANILKKEYTEIGIASVEGVHDGRLMWYAVQEFGRPLSFCTKPDALLNSKIVIFQDQLHRLETTLATLRGEIENASSDRDVYEGKVKDYNTIVDLYNRLIVTTKELVNTYNHEVTVFNTCMQS